MGPEGTFMALRYDAQWHQNVVSSRSLRRGSGAFRFGMVLFSLWLSGCATSTPAPQAGPTDTSDAASLFRWGHEAAKQGDTVRAEQYLSMALDRGFDEKKVLPIMLRVCLSSHRLRAALNHAERYLREHPDDQSLRYLVATIHLSLGQVDQAHVDLNHLLHINPANANAHYLLGVLESSGVSSTRANAHFREYLKLAPQGEHVAEVKSRITDLAVRSDLETPVADDDAAASSEHPVMHAVPLRDSVQASQPESPWFDDRATEPKPARSLEGQQP